MSTLDALIRALYQAHDDPSEEPVVVLGVDRRDLPETIVRLEAARERRDLPAGEKWRRLLMTRPEGR